MDSKVYEKKQYFNDKEPKFQDELINNVPWSYFISLVNLSKEFHSTYCKEEILNIWYEYRQYIQNVDKLHLQPNTFSFNKIKGKSFLKQLSYLGGIVFTFHYSYYRHTTLRLAEELKKEIPNISLGIVLDNDSNKNESAVMRAEHKKYNIEYILAEDPKSIFRMKRILKNNGVIFVYVDGNVGSGEDSKNYTTNLLNSKVNVRSGSFRLLAATKKPFFPALANGQTLEIHNKFYVEKNNINKSIDYLYGIFNDLLTNNPQWWRFWYRYHKQVAQWNDEPLNRKDVNFSDLVFTKLKQTGEKVGVEVNSGRVYKMDN